MVRGNYSTIAVEHMHTLSCAVSMWHASMAEWVDLDLRYKKP